MRLLGFLLAAMVVELSRGIGIGAVILAFAIGFWRVNAVGLILVVVVGSALSLALPDAGGSGKIPHGLSNAAFVAALYCVLALLGYLGGRLARGLRPSDADAVRR